ncbi:MAG: DUF3501 family protein [Alphaproteobacteria bacterium]
MANTDRKTEITRADIMDVAEYTKIRGDRRQKMVAIKKNRRVEVGPVATCYFESYDTMWHQIHEMLYIEKGGEEQIADELYAYNPLIPKGRELVATVMFEIDEPIRRKNFLMRLGGVEETAILKFGDHEVKGVPEEDVDRTTADGKASSVQFIHFPFTDEQAAAFKKDGTQVLTGFTHPEYGHLTVLSEATRKALASDLA